MENLSEIIVTGIAGIILGFIIGFIVFKKLKIVEWLDKKKLSKVIKDPQFLKKKLEENGEIYDMGEKIHVWVITSGGKEILEIKRDPKAKEEIPKLKKKKKARRKKEEDMQDLKLPEDLSDEEMPIEELSEDPEEEIGAEEIPEEEIEDLENLEESGEEDQETE